MFGAFGSGIGQFNMPTAIAVDRAGRIIVGDAGNSRVQIFDNTGTSLFTILNVSPSAVAVDDAGRIYVVERSQHRIRRFSSTGTPDGTLGSFGFGIGQLSNPASIAIGPNRTIYVAELGNQRVQVFTDGFSPLFEFTRRNNANLLAPSAVGVDLAGNLYLCDEAIDELLVYRPVSSALREALVANSIVALNRAQAAPDVSGSFRSAGSNLIGISDFGAAGFIHGVNGDMVGTPDQAISPRLSALVDNNGPTLTHAPLPGSTTIDRGNAGLSPSLDQRGVARPADGNGDGNPRLDIGAVEAVGGRVSGVVFHDSDKDGHISSNERGLPGWTVYIDQNSNGRRDDTEPFAISETDDPATPLLVEAGLYHITDIAAGSHNLRLEPTTMFSATAPRLVNDHNRFTLVKLNTLSLEDAALFEPVLDNGDVAFVAHEGNSYWLFAGTSNGGLRKLSDIVMGPLINTRLSIDRGTITYVLLSSQVLAFLPSGERIAIAEENTPIPEQTERFGGLTLRGAVVSNGSVLFGSLTFTGFKDGVYIGTNEESLARLVDWTSSVPSPMSDLDRFFGFGDLDLDGTTFAFEGIVGDAVDLRLGVYRGVANSSPTLVADRTTAIPSGVGTFVERNVSSVFDYFDNLGHLSLANGRVTFRGAGNNNQLGIYTGSSPTDLRRVADRQTPIPGGLGTFTDFGPTISSDGDIIAFEGFGVNGQHGIFADVRGSLHKVLTRGDSVDGTVVGAVSISEEAVSGNQIAILLKDQRIGGQSLGIAIATFEDDSVHQLTVSDGSVTEGLNFGVVGDAGQIRGQLFQDSDGDGLKDDGEPGLIGWTVYIDTNGNRLRDATEISTTTDSNGNYSLGELPALTTYVVALEPQAGWRQTAPAAAQLHRHTVELGAGETINSHNFGSIQDQGQGGANSNSKINGRLYLDNNANGRFDPGDVGIAGRQVFLDLNNNSLRDNSESPFVTQNDNATTPANEAGIYEISGLPAGSYSVRIVQHADTIQSSPIGNQLTPVAATTGDGPESVAGGDFNGDGWVDLAVANKTTNTISVLLNNRSGFYPSRLDYPVGSIPSSVLVADFDKFNGDDLAVANFSSNSISVFYNTGNASLPFNPANPVTIALPTLPTVPGPRAMAALDFNGPLGKGDGYMDVVVANELSDNVSLLINSGAGGARLIHSASRPAGIDPSAIVAGHFNNDEYIDFVVAGFSSNTVTLYINNYINDRNNPFPFVPGVPIAVARGPFALAAGHLDDDIFLDVAVANFQNNDVSLLRNTGTGALAFARSLAAGIGPTSVIAADLDNDGDADLAVSNKTSRNVSILRNLGGGVFGAPDNLGVADLSTGLAFSLTAQDVYNNGDGVMDLVIANGQRNSISVLQNTLAQGSHRAAVNGLNTAANLDFGMRLAFDPQRPVFTGSAGNDTYRLNANIGGTQLQVFHDQTSLTVPIYTGVMGTVQSLTFNTAAGDDELIMDVPPALQSPSGGIRSDAGGGNNLLSVVRGNFTVDSTAAGGNLNTTLSAGARLTTARLAQNVLVLGDGSHVTIRPGGAQASRLTGLTVGAAASLDITDNALVIDYTGASSVAMIRQQVLTGRGGSGFNKNWSGPGITSSTVAQVNASLPESRSVGYAENALLPLGPYTGFRGVNVDDSAILIAYALTGDANLDGLVNDDDVTVLGASFAPAASNAVWALGDFEYNGFVDDDDVTLLGAFYNPAAMLQAIGQAAVATGPPLLQRATTKADNSSDSSTEKRPAFLLADELFSQLGAAHSANARNVRATTWSPAIDEENPLAPTNLTSLDFATGACDLSDPPLPCSRRPQIRDLWDQALLNHFELV
jgi:hypothetical protein